MKNQIWGCVKINGEGKDIYKFINAVHSQNIAVFEQYVKGGVFCCEIYRSDLKKLQKTAKEFDIKLNIYEYDTLSSEIIRRRRRFGIIIGVAIVIAASLYFSNVIVTIEIQGSETVSEAVIMSALEEIGIKKGTPFGQIDYIYCENSLRLMVNDISWVGMHRTGHRLVVEITEIVQKPDMLEERLPCNILSAKEAEIVSVSVLDGQLMHKIGDYVFPGDMLINGVTSDATGHVTLHHAMGEIIGIYEDTAEFEGEFTKVRLTPTGKTDTRRKIDLFGLKIPLYLGKNSYEYREEENFSAPLVLFGKELPISFEKTKYKEIQRAESTLSEEELSAELMEKVFLYEKNFLSNCEILDREITENKTADTLTFTVKYRLKGDICETKEILVK